MEEVEDLLQVGVYRNLCLYLRDIQVMPLDVVTEALPLQTSPPKTITYTLLETSSDKLNDNVYHPGSSRSVDSEESVVSVYTTQATTAGTVKPLDVYHQIASNLAERITSPIYRFLGYDRNKTDDATTKKPWDKIELLDESAEDATKPDLPPVDNDISSDKDVEELSLDALKKIDKKPEKIVLYSSYLPVKENLEVNDTITDDEDPFEFNDEEEDDEPRQNQFFYVLEVLGSILQLLWGGIVTFFNPPTKVNP